MNYEDLLKKTRLQYKTETDPVKRKIIARFGKMLRTRLDKEMEKKIKTTMF